MKKFCEVCGKIVETQIISKQEIYNVCGENIEVCAQILVCAHCQEEFYCEELDNATLTAAYNQYRRNHKLLFPEEIKKIREMYGLSQRSFARLLNWGDKTVHRYENGAIQDKVHNSLLLFLQNTENMRNYLSDNEIIIDEKQKNKLLKTLDQLNDQSQSSLAKKMTNLIFNKKPSIENGFKAFDYEKFCAMVLFFTHQCPGLPKVKLLKLLNYSDMLFYKENGISISGTRYIHLPYGPVPQDFDLLFGLLTPNHIAHVHVVYKNGYEKHQVIPDHKLMDGVLSDREIKVLERINEKFAAFGSVEISNYSHNEVGLSLDKTGRSHLLRLCKRDGSQRILISFKKGLSCCRQAFFIQL